MPKQRVGIIHFLTKEEGGREQPPTTVLEYCPTTRIAQLAQPKQRFIAMIRGNLKLTNLLPCLIPLRNILKIS